MTVKESSSLLSTPLWSVSQLLLIHDLKMSSGKFVALMVTWATKRQHAPESRNSANRCDSLAFILISI